MTRRKLCPSTLGYGAMFSLPNPALPRAAVVEASSVMIQVPRRPKLVVTASACAKPGSSSAQWRSLHKQRFVPPAVPPAVKKSQLTKRRWLEAQGAHQAHVQLKHGAPSTILTDKGFRFANVIVEARRPAAWPKLKAAQKPDSRLSEPDTVQTESSTFQFEPDTYQTTLLGSYDKILLIDCANVTGWRGKPQVHRIRPRKPPRKRLRQRPRKRSPWVPYLFQKLAQLAVRSRCQVFAMVEGGLLTYEAPKGIHLIRARDIRQRDIGDDAIVEYVFQAVDDGIEAQRFVLVTMDKGLMRRMPFGVGKKPPGWLRDMIALPTVEAAAKVPLATDEPDSGEPGRGWLLDSWASLRSMLPSWLLIESASKAKA